jgi:hypothetical protein
MISAAKWAREKKVPFLGICLGFQVAVIEYARNVAGITDAHSAELDENTPSPVVIFMPEISKTHLGGTMRLGLRSTVFQPGTEWSTVRRLYGDSETIWERHRHRYEVNPEYVERIERAGLLFTGRDETGDRMQVAELRGPWTVTSTQESALTCAQIIHFTLGCRLIQSFAPGLSIRPRRISVSLRLRQAVSKNKSPSSASSSCDLRTTDTSATLRLSRLLGRTALRLERHTPRFLRMVATN